MWKIFKKIGLWTVVVILVPFLLQGNNYWDLLCTCLKFFKKYLCIWLPGLIAGCRICFSCSMWDLVPWPGMEPRVPALGAQSLSHWTTREVLSCWNLTASLGMGTTGEGRTWARGCPPGWADPAGEAGTAGPEVWPQGGHAGELAEWEPAPGLPGTGWRAWLRGKGRKGEADGPGTRKGDFLIS